ncbi:hypothetical protein FRC04_010767 [Tulasnella sp. 424]|nr:hypothetical protein FRC04_010767 [Tulasnella sp. 424]
MANPDTSSLEQSVRVVVEGTALASLLGWLWAYDRANTPKGEVYERATLKGLTYGFPTGLNSGLASFTFFGSREFLFSPLFRKGFSHVEALQPNGSVTDKVADSAAAGAFTGAIVNGIRYRGGRVPSGALAWACTASLLQMGFNKFMPAIRQSNPGRSASQPHSQAQGISDPPQFQPPPEPKGASDRIMDVTTWVAPVKKLSADEYVTVMRKQQASIDKRLDESQARGAQAPPPSDDESWPKS